MKVFSHTTFLVGRRQKPTMTDALYTRPSQTGGRPRQGPRILFAYRPTCPQTPLSLKSDHAGLEKSVKPYDVADSDARSLLVEWPPWPGGTPGGSATSPSGCRRSRRQSQNPRKYDARNRE